MATGATTVMDVFRGGKYAAFRLYVMFGFVSSIMSMPSNIRHTRPNVTILVLWSSVGDYAYGYFPDVMVNHKANSHLAKYKSDPTWPFLANYEVVDWQSNLTFLASYMTTRLNNSLSSPPVAWVFGAEGSAGLGAAHIANTFGALNSLYKNAEHLFLAYLWTLTFVVILSCQHRLLP